MLDDAQLLKQHLRVKRDEVALLKLMVDKLKLQPARRNRDQFGASSERFEDAQGSLIEPTSLREWPARYAANSHAKVSRVPQGWRRSCACVTGTMVNVASVVGVAAELLKGA